MKTITLEEHFGVPAVSKWVPEMQGDWLAGQLDDLGEGRLQEMDAHGIDIQVLSLLSPGVQLLTGQEAVQTARNSNDLLAKAVREHPTRFMGWAALPTDDPRAAADELDRAVSELGLAGALVNSTFGTNGAFLDDPRFEPLLARIEQLGVPLYLHPAAPPQALRNLLFDGFTPVVGHLLETASWGWHSELGLHSLRMVLAGVFERHPDLRVVLGHGGEMLPFMMARIDEFLLPERTGLAELPSAYFLRNFWVTTSALTALPPVLCALQVFGVDRVLFSVDYPLTQMGPVRAVLDALPLAPADKQKVAGGNAATLLGLGS
ncbi:amidohydrolase [Amycolatopsis balhimycina DSM 5908]|uniref:Amidohydrolase n=2 Tax=Pseudonocardiaceae TaxID=2070 RepID=A0A428WB91_AMYBA|nr:amidohydrolase [Amycolatopsis balhimycina DSM 5908]